MNYDSKKIQTVSGQSKQTDSKQTRKHIWILKDRSKLPENTEHHSDSKKFQVHLILLKFTKANFKNKPPLLDLFERDARRMQNRTETFASNVSRLEQVNSVASFFSRSAH